jgi:ACS family pantothenate transporter-like MFS transporter
MWAMIACCIALVIWTAILAYMDRRNRKNLDIDEARGSLSIVVDGKE